MEIMATIAERKIREAMEKGEFNDLPGRGKPLTIEDDAGIPAELRMAYKSAEKCRVRAAGGGASA